MALSTKNKHVMVIRKIFKLNYDAREIVNIPPSPKIETKDSPRASFTDAEYKLLPKTMREEAWRGVSVRDKVLRIYQVFWCWVGATPGLADVTLHVLRHSAAVWMAEAEVPMSEIAQYLGHTSMRTTESH